MKEIIVKPEEIKMIAVDRTSLIPLRRKMVDHRRKKRDDAVRRWAIVSGASLALNVFQAVMIYILQAGPI